MQYSKYCNNAPTGTLFLLAESDTPQLKCSPFRCYFLFAKKSKSKFYCITETEVFSVLREKTVDQNTHSLVDTSSKCKDPPTKN